MSRLLINERPLQVLPTLASLIGLNEAIVLQQIHYWIQGNKERQSAHHHKDGKWWTYNTAEQWGEQFPWWSLSTIKRVFKSLQNKELLFVDQLADDPYDRTNWYSINYGKLEELEPDESMHCVNMNQSVVSDCDDDPLVQNDTMNNKESETNTETNKDDDDRRAGAHEETPEPETDDDRDGRWLIQQVRDKGFMYIDPDSKKLAIQIEQDFGDDEILKALNATHEAHQKKISNGGRGISAPLAYLRQVILGMEDTYQPRSHGGNNERSQRNTNRTHKAPSDGTGQYDHYDDVLIE